MSVSIVVPWRSTPDRSRNWAYLRRRYQKLFPTWELIEPNNPGKWNKSAAVNIGAKQASGDVLVIADADCLLPENILRQAAADALKHPWVVPHGHVYRLSEGATTSLIAGSFNPETVTRKHTYRGAYKGIPGGGVFVIRRDSFLSIGGFDPKFTGWGCEDSSFGTAADTLLGAHHRYMRTPLIHLWHNPGRRSHSREYGANLGRKREYVAASKTREQMAEFLKIPLPSIITVCQVDGSDYGPSNN